MGSRFWDLGAEPGTGHEARGGRCPSFIRLDWVGLGVPWLSGLFGRATPMSKSSGQYGVGRRSLQLNDAHPRILASDFELLNSHLICPCYQPCGQGW
jgi:hypothetical protein